MMLMKCSENGHDAIEQVKRTQPDVMTLDIKMPDMNGFGSIWSNDGPSPTSQHHGRCLNGGGSWGHASSACTRSN